MYWGILDIFNAYYFSLLKCYANYEETSQDRIAS